jgi:predicted GH43/DUF377 family glycosyl hydrolase
MRLHKVLIPLLICATSVVHSQSSWHRFSDPVVPVWSGDFNDPNNYKLLFFPSVVYDATKGLYRMWFMYLPGWSGVPYNIGYAVSTDGIDWLMYARNPVLQPGSPGSFDYPNIHDPFVMRDGNGYRMYYTGFTGSRYAIGIATSPDGIRWTKYAGNPVLTAQPNPWEFAGPAEPKVIFDGTQYKMFYTGVDASGTYGIGLATSSDGFAWERYSSNPVLPKGPPGSWDQYAVGTIATFFANGKYYLYYGGGPYTPIGYAISTNGVDWTKYSGNPVFSPGPSGTWDGSRVEHGSILVEGTGLKFWYSGYGYSSGLGGYAWQLGYATADSIDVVKSPPENNNDVPEVYSLEQSFPNPFNPETEIAFSLPRSEHVTLKIFDSLGREIATLVDEVRPVGRQTVKWRPTLVSSGAYFYRMQAGTFSETKKLILMK